jgi:hypothetical protein
VKNQKIDYNSIIVIISLYLRMSFLKEVVNFMMWYEILFLTIVTNMDALRGEERSAGGEKKVSKVFYYFGSYIKLMYVFEN